MRNVFRIISMMMLLWVFASAMPIKAYSQTIDLPTGFTSVTEDDGLGNMKTVYVTSIIKGTSPVTIDFNVTGGVGPESWTIGSMLCTDGACPLIVNSVSIEATNGQLKITPSDVHIFEFILTVSKGGPAVSQLVRIKITRTPIDLVFVLDKSGSMGTISSGSTTRWAALVSAVEAFMDKFESFRVEGDRVAITYFHSVVENGFGTPANPFIPITDPMAVNSSKTQVHNSLMANGPASMTAMGEGMVDALAKHKLPPPTPAHTRIELLFTDGYQNYPNNDRLVSLNGTTLNDNTPINVGNGPGSISIYTIGIGAAGSLPDILSVIANKNRGIPSGSTSVPLKSASWVTQTGNESSFKMDFSNGFKSMLEQFSPQILGVQQGVLSRTGKIADSLVVDCNKKTDQILFEVYTQRPIPVAIEKDGIAVTPTYVRSGPGYQIFVFKSVGNISTFKSQGKWKLKIAGGANLGGFSAVNNVGVDYNILAMTDDHNLDYYCSPGADQFKVGDNLKPVIKIAYTGSPVVDAKAQAILLKPGQDLGNLLATTVLKIDTTAGADPGSLGNQKYNQLLNDPSFLAKMLPKEQSFVLSHTSQGQYEVSAGALDTAGVYRILFFINDTLPGGDIIQRREEQSFYVRFGDIDFPSSQPVLTGSGNQWVLTFRPKTTQKLFVGPAFQDGFGLTGTGIQIKNVIDKGDGTYEIKFEGNPDTEIKLTLLDAPVYTGTLTDIKCYGPDAGIWLKIKCWLIAMGLPAWLIWIILLTIVILLWLIFKKKK